ncbi:MAG: gliding motility lipoprotein GldB [Bacteroidia bacterium]|nr:gliding motility lipoprotein GldB [Bacteroidia bacterium]
MKYWKYIVLIMCIIYSCKKEKKIPNQILEIPVNVDVIRFDRKLAATTEVSLPVLKADYPYFFPAQYPDSIWTAKLTDTLQLEILSEVDKVFTDFEKEREEIRLFYKHWLHYFPNTAPMPKVVTMISEVDYQNRIILADTLVLVALDSYLGESHKFYEGMDRYIAAQLDPVYLLSDLADAFIAAKVPPPKERTFLSQMTYYGKKLYLKDLLLPWRDDPEKIKYTREELDWARANEDPIWRYFIERELLYSTDKGLVPRFLNDAPFSKFRLELDSESPGRIGQYMGWQIVRAFMENNDVEVHQMLTLSGRDIFMRSKFKPKK